MGQSLQEGTIGIASMGAKFDQLSRPQHPCKPEGKRNMARPMFERDQSIRLPEQFLTQLQAADD